MKKAIIIWLILLMSIVVGCEEDVITNRLEENEMEIKSISSTGQVYEEVSGYLENATPINTTGTGELVYPYPNDSKSVRTED